jgi:hypothetical protein
MTTNDDIRVELRLKPRQLSGIEESEHEWFIGVIGISKHHSIFQCHYAHDLHASSQFYKQWFDLEERRGWAILFRAFEPKPEPGQPDEYFAGWVSPERGAEVDQWLIFLNQEIANRLSHKQPTPVRRELICVGTFKELGFDDTPDTPSLAASRGRLSTTHKHQIVAYLNTAPVIVVSPGERDDVFDPENSAGSASYATDGTYIWPRVLAYYVDRYDVALPAEFLAHGEAAEWKLPPLIDKSALRLPKI